MASRMTDGWKIIKDHIVYVKDNKVLKGIEPLDGDKCRTVYVYERSRFSCPSKICPSTYQFREHIDTNMYMKPKENIYD